MKISKRLVLFTSVTLPLVACAPSRAPQAIAVATVSMKAVGCKVSMSEMWNGLQRVAEDGAAFPSADEVRAAVTKAGADRGLTGPAFDAYVGAFVANYVATIDGITASLAPGGVADWQKALAEMEAGVRPTDLHADLVTKLDASQAALTAAEQNLNATCQLTDVASDDDDAERGMVRADAGTVWADLKAAQPAEVYGARRVLATAYQSCDVVAAAPMTAATPNVAGIKVLGRHPAGGLRRAITNPATVAASDYYIVNRAQPSGSCFEVRANPLIYDFGGKPYFTAKAPKVLDIFKNGGSGTKVLGIDCSAYVFSSLMAAGLKTDPAREMKASLVLAYGSGSFKEPQSNNMRCLAKIQVTKDKSVQAGDIVAIDGHVVMIDQAGADPFGLRKISRAADCTADKLSYRNFDFVIAQSSPSKKGIGINRFEARDYLSESATIRKGLTAYAVASCRASFGLSPALKSPTLSVIRHKHTAECTMPALQFAHEDCVSSCRAR